MKFENQENLEQYILEKIKSSKNHFGEVSLEARLNYLYGYYLGVCEGKEWRPNLESKDFDICK